jgi:hypothetical protein
LNVKANGEIISTIISSRDATIFASSVKLNRSHPHRLARLVGIFPPSRATFFHDFDIETIVARQLEYSVSHFIDCHSAARTFTALQDIISSHHLLTSENRKRRTV